jgi:hypothetical protein
LESIHLKLLFETLQPIGAEPFDSVNLKLTAVFSGPILEEIRRSGLQHYLAPPRRYATLEKTGKGVEPYECKVKTFRHPLDN